MDLARWVDRAACNGDPSDLWDPPVTVQNLFTCGACPVRAQCAADAIAAADRHTVRLGLDLRRATNRDRLPAIAGDGTRMRVRLSQTRRRIAVDHG